MPVAPSFSAVGDIISVAQLVKDVVKTLDDARGSSADYIQVMRELGNLESLLQDLGSLAGACDQNSNYQSLAGTARLEALKCKALITPFEEKISKYKESLRTGGSGHLSKD